MDVGKIIKSARLSLGMTQEELADKIGVQKSAVAKWENGRVSEIKRSNLKKLADTLGLKPIVLLGDVESTPVQIADFHAKVLKDDEVMEMLHQYYDLSVEKQKIVRDLVKSLSK